MDKEKQQPIKVTSGGESGETPRKSTGKEEGNSIKEEEKGKIGTDEGGRTSCKDHFSSQIFCIVDH